MTVVPPGQEDRARAYAAATQSSVRKTERWIEDAALWREANGADELTLEEIVIIMAEQGGVSVDQLLTRAAEIRQRMDEGGSFPSGRLLPN